MTINRFNSIVLAACIVAASLIASALIMTYHPAAAASSLPPATLAARLAGTPPLAQASVEEQFRSQVLAAPALHSFPYNGKTYTLTDIKVNQVIYAPKEDTFSVPYNYVWQPAMPPTGPQSSVCTLNNDGYGHYYDTAVISSLESGGTAQSAPVTVK